MHIRLKATGRCWAVNKLARWQIKLSKANNKPGELFHPSPSNPTAQLNYRSSLVEGPNMFALIDFLWLPACLPAVAAAFLCDNCILQIFTCCTQFAQWDYAYAWFDFGLPTLHSPPPFMLSKIVVDYWVAAVNHRLIGHHAQHSAADHTANPSQRSRGGHSNSDSDSDGNVVAVVGSVCWPFA